LFKTILLISAPILLFSSQINFDKVFYKKVTADLLSTNVTIIVTRKIQNDINPILNKYNDIILNEKKVSKQRGNFSISPKYIYKNNISTLVGYNGNLSYTISSPSYEYVNAFLSTLLEEKDERNLSITISALNWKISDELKEKTNNDLRLESILWASKYAKTLEQKTMSKCLVKEININQKNNYIQGKPMMVRNMSSNSNIAIPQQSNNKISLTVNYRMECK